MAKKTENKKTKQDLINEENVRLSELFKKLPPNKLELAKGLIENAAFMYVTLKELTEIINTNGVKEQYKNGKNQYGYKDSTENKTYDKMIKNYNNTIKQLNDMLPKESEKKKDDGFDSFGVD